MSTCLPSSNFQFVYGKKIKAICISVKKKFPEPDVWKCLNASPHSKGWVYKNYWRLKKKERYFIVLGINILKKQKKRYDLSQMIEGLYFHSVVWGKNESQRDGTPKLPFPVSLPKYWSWEFGIQIKFLMRTAGIQLCELPPMSCISWQLEPGARSQESGARSPSQGFILRIPVGMSMFWSEPKH